MRGLLSKRGQEMSISTLVLIVLAIIVLVLVIVGFTGGWQNLWDRITNFGGGKSNVASVVQACTLSCNTGTEYDYCSYLRDVRFGRDAKIGDGKYNCKALEIVPNSGLASCPQFAASSCSVIGPRTKQEVDCTSIKGRDGRSIARYLLSSSADGADSVNYCDAGKRSDRIEINNENIKSYLDSGYSTDKEYVLKADSSSTGKVCCLIVPLS